MRRRRRASSSKLLPASQLYGGGSSGNALKGEYTHRTDIHEAIQRRHERGMGWINGDGYWEQNGRRWRVPFGVRAAFRERLTFGHIAQKHPYYVQWQHPNGDGTARTLRRSCQTLGGAVSFITLRAYRVDEDAFIVCKLGFYVPRKLMGKFPRRLSDGKLYYWCPRCMQPRTYKRIDPPDVFYADKKFWNDEKGHYEWKNVRLALLRCSHCGLTNRDRKFRGSNTPVEKTKLKAQRRRRRR